MNSKTSAGENAKDRLRREQAEQTFRLYRQASERLFARRRAELAIWLIVAAIVYGAFFWRTWEHLAPIERGVGSVFVATLPYLFAAGLIALFPILFYLVFEKFPLEMLRREKPVEVGAFFRPPEPRRPETSLTPANTLKLLKAMADTSSRIAEKIYTRAGVYLLIGVMIAFSGLAFFYIQTQALATSELVTKLEIQAAVLGRRTPESNEGRNESAGAGKDRSPLEAWMEKVPGLVGRVGVLFFIELVAFFFLRQYRAAMDEYRYFEAIKRRREENLVLSTIFFQSSEKVSFADFVKDWSLYSDVPKLAAGETTEMLETRKLTKDEAALFEKMIDVVTKAKG